MLCFHILRKGNSINLLNINRKLGSRTVVTYGNRLVVAYRQIGDNILSDVYLSNKAVKTVNINISPVCGGKRSSGFIQHNHARCICCAYAKGLNKLFKTLCFAAVVHCKFLFPKGTQCIIACTIIR